jgi:hypothetical protein
MHEVLVASVHDVRHFGNLLRGVNFIDVSCLTFLLRGSARNIDVYFQFATVIITSGGLTVFVEESSLVAGMWPNPVRYI